ncbi:MAG: hypothetical protein HY557_00335, partial [Euryarchaeota archaeon]|nr:hypothetical protein [Euryarchaeota archaeon]
RVELRFYASRDNTTWKGPLSFGSASANAWTFPFPQGAGHYRLFARAQDARGQWEADQPPDAAEVVLGYDDVAPVSALEPVTGYWFDGPIPLVATATDDVSGLAAVDVWYAFRPSLRDTWSEWTLAGSDDDAPYALSFPFPKGEGHYAFTTRAKDVAGNEEPGRPAGIAAGFNAGPPVAPFLLPPTFVDPDTRRTNLTWLASPSSDVGRLEIHRGLASEFVPDLRPCASSATCVAALEPGTTTAWAPLGAENATAYFRVVAIDEGGLANGSVAVAATFHGFGFDSPNTAADPSALPLDVAWSERLGFDGACTDCADVFAVSLGRAESLRLLLAVPASGDFRITVFDAALEAVWEADRAGFGGWETLFVFTPIPRVLYVIVDWGFHVGADGRNGGWYTLTATVLPP